jgi:repressor LexA
MDDITARQRRIVDYISDTVRDRGYPPTVREIGEAVGLTSSSSVHAQLANLERAGLLRRDPTKPRAMELRGPENRSSRAGDLRPRAASVAVPLLGRISAGTPTMAAEEIEEHLAVPAGFAGATDHFALHVRGDSMIGAGILDGDIVVIRRQNAADEGDIVAALMEGPGDEEEATVKRFHRDRSTGQVMLVPENPSLSPFPLGDGRIAGKVVSVLRKL